MRIVGSSIMLAPNERSLLLNTLACFLVRVTTIVLPKSGRFSYQLSLSRKATTSPNIATAGAAKLFATAFWAISRSVPVSVPCCPVVAQRTSATGKSPRTPCFSISLVIDPRRSTPINITWVPPSFASAA